MPLKIKSAIKVSGVFVMGFPTVYRDYIKKCVVQVLKSWYSAGSLNKRTISNIFALNLESHPHLLIKNKYLAKSVKTTRSMSNYSM